jgi:hypothetical protein
MQERKRKILAWHFCGDTLRDGRPIPPDGEALDHEGELIMCAKGLHASVKIMDALSYSPGYIICRVKCEGIIIKDTDKLVCSKRTIIWRIQGEEVLRLFARQQAFSVIHVWDPPPVVKEYLETGKKEIQAAAGDAAWDAAWDAAGAAARAAAWAAAGDAAWDAARDAARAAAWAAAGDAAGAAAQDAARDAARAAAWDAAGAAAGDAAQAAARDAAEKQLVKLVISEHKLCQKKITK